MGLLWNWYALPAWLVLVSAGGMAAFVFFARPDRAPNRRLALQLALEAFVVGTLGGAVWVFDDPRLVYALCGTAFFLVWPKLWTYYSFLATLPTPLAAPIRSPGRLSVFLALTVAAGLSWFLRPDLYISAVGPWPYSPFAIYPGAGFFMIMNLWAVMWVVGLAFSVSAFRHAKTPIVRRQTRAYLLAFGFRDLSFGVVTLLLTFLPASHPSYIWVFLAFPMIWVVYPLLVGYAILRTQLFDIDVKVKWTISRGAVAGAFAAAFFVASEIAEALVSNEAGPVVGLAAAGGLALGFRPLRRAADRLADAAMPGVRPTPEYLTGRRHEFYRAALEGALQDGKVTDRERDILDRLRRELRIASDEATVLEREVAHTFRGAAA
ncbi:MAG: hypothetical protein ACT4PT_04935 [Methanobacteriota archaeon]